MKAHDLAKSLLKQSNVLYLDWIIERTFNK